MKNGLKERVTIGEFLASPYKPNYFKMVPKVNRKEFVLSMLGKETLNRFLLTEEREYFQDVCQEEIQSSNDSKEISEWKRIEEQVKSLKNPRVARGVNFSKLFDSNYYEELLDFGNFRVQMKSVPDGVWTYTEERYEFFRKFQAPSLLIAKFTSEAKMKIVERLFERVITGYELSCLSSERQYLITYNELFLAELTELFERRGVFFECETSKIIKEVAFSEGLGELNRSWVQDGRSESIKFKDIPSKSISNLDDDEGWRYPRGKGYAGLLSKMTDECLIYSMSETLSKVMAYSYEYFLLTIAFEKPSTSVTNYYVDLPFE